MSEAPDAAPKGPLATPLFRALWLATIVSNVGTWMNDVGAAWLMTSLAPNPLWVAMVQAATTLPIFLFALPAGALADVVDRRKLLIGAQALTLVGAAGLTAATFLDLTTAPLLLLFTAIMGVGAALSAPAFQSIVPELVDKRVLPDAITLNGLGINIARAVGPALGGLIVAAAGPAAVFGLNALSFLAVMFVLMAWKRPPQTSHLPPEHFLGAIRAGYRYARHAPELQTVLLRAVAFFLFASALWALLPLVGRRELGLSAAGYGTLLGCMGLGAIGGAFALKPLRKFADANALSLAGSLLFAAATLGLAFAKDAYFAGGVMALAGLAWIAMLASLNVAAQTVVPSWVKARALSIYLLVFQGSMAAGSLIWGALALRIDIAGALTVAAVALVLATGLGLRFKLRAATALNLAPSGHWAEPIVAAEMAPEDRGPVMVSIEYRIDPAEAAEFARALAKLKRVRKRDGALSWHVFQDAADPASMTECFVLPSWLEHLRQHERVTHDDRLTQADIQRFHIADTPPVVRHLIAPPKH